MNIMDAYQNGFFLQEKQDIARAHEASAATVQYADSQSLTWLGIGPVLLLGKGVCDVADQDKCHEYLEQIFHERIVCCLFRI